MDIGPQYVAEPYRDLVSWLLSTSLKKTRVLQHVKYCLCQTRPLPPRPKEKVERFLVATLQLVSFVDIYSPAPSAFMQIYFKNGEGEGELERHDECISWKLEGDVSIFIRSKKFLGSLS